jgi:hypothetical protein
MCEFVPKSDFGGLPSSCLLAILAVQGLRCITPQNWKLTKRMTADVRANMAPPMMQMMRQKSRTTEAYRYFHHLESAGRPVPWSPMNEPEKKRTCMNKIVF